MAPMPAAIAMARCGRSIANSQSRTKITASVQSTPTHNANIAAATRIERRRRRRPASWERRRVSGDISDLRFRISDFEFQTLTLGEVNKFPDQPFGEHQEHN